MKTEKNNKVIFTPKKHFEKNTINCVSGLFKKITPDSAKLLNNFDEIVQSVLPLNSKQIQELPKNIRQLSHELTDKRSSRKSGYMNSPVQSAAYIRYFMWWNLVRLVYLFQNLDIKLNDGDYAIDLGSGPLTVVCAMWIAYPQFREKKITWYCADSSISTITRGEEIFLSLAAKTPLSENALAHWKIIKIKGGLNSTFREKAKLITCANMMNEIFWNAKDTLEVVAKNVAQKLASLVTDDGSVLVIEPGIPLSGKFIALLRASLMKRKFLPKAPCTHLGECPLPGIFNSKLKEEGKSAKWCHFVFPGSEAPISLQKRSKLANLEKERISLSFIFAQKNHSKEQEILPSKDEETKQNISQNLFVRITSDPIFLPGNRLGRYGCSCKGLVLLESQMTEQGQSPAKTEWTSGSLVEVSGDLPDLIDTKSGAHRIISKK